MKKTSSTVLTLAAVFLAAHLPARASETDDRIESTFTKSYAYQTYLHDDAIVVRSKDGKVILSGKVSRESHKDLAAETVSNLPGVLAVDNQLKVSGKHPAENSDAWIQMKVETALLFHRNVSAVDTKVSVKDGIVTLKGKADNAAQKDLTSEYVADVQGVKDVKNEMKVLAGKSNPGQTLGEKVDDASITAQVKISLLSHRSTSAIETHVTTKDGVVTVSGKAANAAEKDLVTKLAADIHGVSSVVNNMVISASVSNK